MPGLLDRWNDALVEMRRRHPDFRRLQFDWENTLVVERLNREPFLENFERAWEIVSNSERGEDVGVEVIRDWSGFRVQ
jgi:hypothetical protein